RWSRRRPLRSRSSAVCTKLSHGAHQPDPGPDRFLRARRRGDGVRGGDLREVPRADRDPPRLREPGHPGPRRLRDRVGDRAVRSAQPPRRRPREGEGATASTDLPTLLGFVFGTSGVSAANGTTATAGTATAITTAASGTFAAGSLCRVGALGDGRGGGQFAAILSHVTTTLTLLTAIGGSP